MTADGPARPRVAILADSLVVGGAERVVEALALRLGSRGFDVTVGCLRAAGPIGASLAARGVPVESDLGPARLAPGQVFAVRRWLRRTRADVLFVLDHSNALFYGRLAARSLDRPAVAAVHRTRRADGSASLGTIDRLLLPWTAAVIAVSEGHATYLRDREGVRGDRLRVVYNGVDPDRFAPALDAGRRTRERRTLGLPDGATTFGSVAALRPEKNHESLLRALATRDLADAHLVVVGDGARREALEAEAADRGVAERVHWLGWMDDVVGVLAAIDALVLPSHPNVETFPMCVLEAMAAGRPAVATDVGSLDEMIVDGETGWLVPPGNDAALVQALRDAACNPVETERRGAAARRRLLEHFDENHMVDGVARILREVTDRN